MQGLPSVVKIMQMPEYALFSDKVLQAECDSMQKLQIVQEVYHLEEWKKQQAHHAGEEPQQVAHHADSLHTQCSETRGQSQVRSAEAAGIVSQEPLAKRQRVETNAADMREELQAEIDQLTSQNRLQELQQQLAKQKQAALTLQKEAELQEATEKQAALEFAQRQDNLKMRQMMWNAAHHGSPLTTEIMTGSVLNFGVQPGDTLCTPVTLDAEDQTVVPSSNAAEAYTVPAAKPSRVAKALQHPEFFQSQTIAGRYQEWIGGGQYAGIKSQLVMGRNGLVLPRTGHAKAAVDNLRKKRNLPEAIEQLVMQGLSSSAAVALMTKVVNDFGLRGISKQSEAFHWLAKDSAARAETRVLFETGKTVKQFNVAYDLEISKALDGQAA